MPEAFIVERGRPVKKRPRQIAFDSAPSLKEADPEAQAFAAGLRRDVAEWRHRQRRRAEGCGIEHAARRIAAQCGVSMEYALIAARLMKGGPR